LEDKETTSTSNGLDVTPTPLEMQEKEHKALTGPTWFKSPILLPLSPLLIVGLPLTLLFLSEESSDFG
jgi:hypothetical protein